MSQWIQPIKLHREAYCPFCASDLPPDATRYRWGVAMCACCSSQLTIARLEVVCRGLAEEVEEGNVSSVHGLVFWTPKRFGHPRTSLYAQTTKDPVRLGRNAYPPDVPSPGLLTV